MALHLYFRLRSITWLISWKRRTRQFAPRLSIYVIFLSALNMFAAPVQAQPAQDKCTSFGTSGSTSQLPGEQNFRRLIECLKELQSTIETLQNARRALQTDNQNLALSVQTLKSSLNQAPKPISRQCDRNEKGQIDCDARCSDNERVVIGLCRITDGLGAIQNSGLDPATNQWRCLWNSQPYARGEAVAFCAAR
jgi:hypothetical protein